MEAARAAGHHALENDHRRGETIELLDHDIKLVMDGECQRIAEAIIHRAFPDHAILGEEGNVSTDHAIEWVIDPIDGTANYARGFPYWCTSIAAQRNGQTVAGCVVIPPFGEIYTATSNGPALCNGKPIAPAGTASIDRSILYTGLTKEIDPRSVEFFGTMARRVSKIRVVGAAAIDICHVACGRSDAYFEAGIYLWDVAAAQLIAERAGAVCTAWPRNEPHGLRFLCSVPALHDILRRDVESCFPSEASVSDTPKKSNGYGIS